MRNFAQRGRRAPESATKAALGSLILATACGAQSGLGMQLLAVPDSKFEPGAVIADGIVLNGRARNPALLCSQRASMGEVAIEPGAAGDLTANDLTEIQAKVGANVDKTLDANASYQNKFRTNVQIKNLKSFTLAESDILGGATSSRASECNQLIGSDSRRLSVLTTVYVGDVVLSIESTASAKVGAKVDEDSQVADYLQGQLGAGWQVEDSKTLAGAGLTIGYLRSDNQGLIKTK